MFIKTTFKFLRDSLEIVSYIYTDYIKSDVKSNIKHDKKKTQDF